MYLMVRCEHILQPCVSRLAVVGGYFFSFCDQSCNRHKASLFCDYCTKGSRRFWGCNIILSCSAKARAGKLGETIVKKIMLLASTAGGLCV